MRALDCCAGAGGLSLGLQRAGFDVHGIELDAAACETHRAVHRALADDNTSWCGWCAEVERC